MTLPELRTARLVLAPAVDPAWADALAALTVATEGETGPPSEARLAHARLTLERSARGFANGTFGLWLLARPGETAWLGWAGLKAADDPARPELMYGLHPAARGAGLATEAVRALVAHAFERPGVVEVWGATRPENDPSARVMAAAGLVEAEPRVLDGTRYRIFTVARA